MTPNEARAMTTEQLRDWLAIDDGWTRPVPTVDPNDDAGWYRKDITVAGKETEQWRYPHPHLNTLDGAAAALPEPWVWLKVCGPRGHIVYEAWNSDHAEGKLIVVTQESSNEVHDRYLLAVLARLAMKGDNQ